MQTTFNVKDRARVRGRAQVGTVTRVADGMVHLEYEPRPGTITFGLYPAEHLEKIEPPSPQPSPPGEGEKPRVLRRASAKDVLPAAKT